MSNALPRLKLLRFQDVPEYTIPERHSGSQDSCDILILWWAMFFCALLRFILVSFPDTPQGYNPCMVSCASPQRSCSQVMTLLAPINSPRFLEAMVRGCLWIESAHSLAGDAVSWA